MSTPTPRQLAAYQRRTLKKMRETLLTLAEAWDGVDEFYRGELTDLADQVDVVIAHLLEDAP